MSLSKFPFQETKSRKTIAIHESQFPESPIQWTIQRWHGVSIALIWIYPVQVDKFGQTLSFVNKGSVSIEFSQGSNYKINLTNNQKSKTSLISLLNLKKNFDYLINETQSDTEYVINQINRHLVAVLLQESIHFLQKEKYSKIYELIFSFYNNSYVNDVVLHLLRAIYGKKGIFWYEEQPIEKDARILVQEFMKLVF